MSQIFPKTLGRNHVRLSNIWAVVAPVLYLLDANVLITANNLYYPIDQVPEFWSWLKYQGESGNVKIPLEIMEEIQPGRKENDSFWDWISNAQVKQALLFDEAVDAKLVRYVVSNGYASDLKDDEVEQIGRDAFLIAYALANTAERCVVTTENSRPSAQRQNQKIPDVCRTLRVSCCDPFTLNRDLGFRTDWRR